MKKSKPAALIFTAVCLFSACSEKINETEGLTEDTDIIYEADETNYSDVWFTGEITDPSDAWTTPESTESTESKAPAAEEETEIKASEAENSGVIYCDLEGYTDFYFFPVKNCFGEDYYVYISNFGDGCNFSMDIRTEDDANPQEGFQYISVLASPAPSVLYENPSCEEMTEMLKKFDPTKCSYTFNEKEPDASMPDKAAAVMGEIKLSGIFDGNTDSLSECRYNVSGFVLNGEIINYFPDNRLSAEFFDHNGKTVVKLSIDDYFDLSEMINAHKNDIPAPEEAIQAYGSSCRAEGYYYCDEAALLDYFGEKGKSPLKTAPETVMKEIYYEPDKAMLAKEAFSFFADPSEYAFDSSRYFCFGSAGICPPEEAGTYSYMTTGSLEFFSGDPECSFSLDRSGYFTEKRRIEKEKYEIAAEKSGIINGNECNYIEYYNDKHYYAQLHFTAEGKNYCAAAAVSRASWNEKTRPVLKEFFSSVTDASSLEMPDFSDNADDYFVSVSDKDEKYDEVLKGIKAKIPEGFSRSKSSSESAEITPDDGGYDMYFKIYNTEKTFIFDSMGRKRFHEQYTPSGHYFGKLVDLKYFKRDGRDCILSLTRCTSFSSGTSYIILYKYGNYVIEAFYSGKNTNGRNGYDIAREFISSVQI